MTCMIPYALKYKDPQGIVWHPYSVDFTSPEGKFEVHIYAISPEHAHLQLAALKENGRVLGQVTDIIPC